MAIPTGKLCVTPQDPRISYNLVEGETLKTCPYNVSHAVLPLKFSKHVLNCHRLHLKEQTAKGQRSLFGICQYNRAHHVKSEDLGAHEALCKAELETDPWEWGDSQDVTTSSPLEPSTGSGVPNPTPTALEGISTAIGPGIVNQVNDFQATIQELGEWDRDAVTMPKFDPNRRIHQLRLSGYDYISIPVGLTRKEKRDFYLSESAKLASYRKPTGKPTYPSNEEMDKPVKKNTGIASFVSDSTWSLSTGYARSGRTTEDEDDDDWSMCTGMINQSFGCD